MDIDGTTNVNNSDRIYVTDTFDGMHAIALNEITGLYTGTEAENTVLASVKTITGYLLQLMEKVRTISQRAG